MTSGNFHSISLYSIIILREERQRHEISGIPELAQSIEKLGLIHPIVITRENVLVAGERRLEACRLLGHTHINVQYVDEVDPTTLKLIEYEENIKRKNLPWEDEVRMVAGFHSLMKSAEPGWSIEKTADALNMATGEVSNKISVATTDNPLAKKAEKYSVALGIVKRAEARKDEKALEELQSFVDGAAAERPPESILVEDFIQWAPTYDGPRFNFLHCDFPYGIGADKFNQGAASAHGDYEDSPDTFWSLVNCLGDNLDHLITESCHLMFWFAMRSRSDRLYEPIAAALEAQGWTINPMPLIWMKSDGAGVLPDPERGPRQIYETCLLGSRGDRKIIRAVANAYAAPIVSSRHMSEKSEPMLRHFFSMLVDKNSLVLDPTCGSGSALRAAESLGASYVIGLERNEEFADRARSALRASRVLRQTSTSINSST